MLSQGEGAPPPESVLATGSAFFYMRERGKTVVGIASLGARSEKIVRSYLRKVPKPNTANGAQSAADGAAPRDGDAASQALVFDGAMIRDESQIAPCRGTATPIRQR
jgi:hypothetical protein